MMDKFIDRADLFKSMFDAVPEILLLIDQDFRIIHRNSAAMTLMSEGREGGLPLRIGSAAHCLHATETLAGCGYSTHCSDCLIRTSVNKAFQGGMVRRETAQLQILDNGKAAELYIMITASKLQFEGTALVLVVMEDITSLKKIEEELRNNSVQLETANRELEAFNYTVVHDLKSPLMNICNFSDLLLEKYSTGMNKQGAEFIQRINSSAWRMSQLIDDMLALSKTAHDEMTREDVDLSELARHVVDDFTKTNTVRTIEFIIAPNLRADCDARMVYVVLVNLINNAIKYTSGHASARIEFGTLKQDGGQIFYVRDDGAGFDMSKAEKLFSPFHRFHDPSRFPGTGIGLSTVRRIIQRHGGKIWAASAVEEGTTFFFTL
jgi:signal transduction histidine kinase